MLQLRSATIAPLWRDITCDLHPGEFLAILGPNGSGKSTLLRAALGMQRLDSGTVTLGGRVGYIPQQQMFPAHLPARVRDLVALAGGEPENLLDYVGASSLIDAHVGRLSGGQQQLVRQTQAFAQNPELILADEPFLSLDVARQRHTIARFRKSGAAVAMVTHSIDPVIDVVDKVLYIAPGGHVLGTADEVLQSDVLSELYGAPVQVVRAGGKTVII
ncbi:metal ABC transporter ATP-binding protein [Corynebacterium sp. p3-SID1056]|uniref:metal ABC transporter ATP-binding protein n=1 Tax=Corynebacterium sp. p3-SID1056 TaxID=2916092 RepID=UPI0021A3E1DD|nr:metal ABC transporter ATP-binding protein [Corynebacterium sp. p3-SID1056]MCT2339658.1 metal ABC transporter ATP-binding protein [Corynebacterium sp. p3-SID1056]